MNEDRELLGEYSGSEHEPLEEELIEQWAANNYPQSYYVPEVPVQTSTLRGNTKYIDAIVFERWPFASEEEYRRKALEQRVININTGEFSDSESQVQFILQNFVQEPVKVRVFEAKRKMNFKSIGQILAYSEFFPEYYAPYADIEVVEKGIIYGEEDEMCFKTAERYGISPHPVTWS